MSSLVGRRLDAHQDNVVRQDVVIDFHSVVMVPIVTDCLVGHKNTINCLAVSRNGNMLASRGCDGMRIWDLKRRVQLPTPPQTPAVRNPADPVTCACWITRHEATRKMLCYGTRLGFIGIWHQQGEGLQDFDAKVSRRVGMGKEIMCLAYDHTGDKLEFVELATTIPRTMNFNCTASRNILVFGMYDSEIHTLRGTDGIVITTNSAGPLIGYASVDAAQMLFLMDNVTNGFSLHRLEDAVCICTYNTNPVKTFPKQVVFGRKATLVVGGSDTGVIYIFDKNEGTLKQVLQHADKGRVQTVTTYDGTHHSLIFGATSMNNTEPTISIWCRKLDSVAKSTNDHPLESALKNFVRGIAQLTITMALIAYVLRTHNTSRISLAPLGNAWQEYSKKFNRPQDLTDDVCLLVEKYIEDQKRGEGFERVRSPVDNKKYAWTSEAHHIRQ
ncbi:WD40-repeat-containing domain protein [Suillus fuscotomentosus]|uniref:WD40-repeat-containing domain protein n=1 Tax=Suillus fuscotomentosus TaxID=1912939 RepID=A0AAD4E8Z5_9AGAM|nr:WD40-repeat-containing domain protein [Suillus fuscotomentosus]KAG1901790.1 WD40-repeat-containing domain protein [Suillus fuscotomentosus]